MHDDATQRYSIRVKKKPDRNGLKAGASGEIRGHRQYSSPFRFCLFYTVFISQLSLILIHILFEIVTLLNSRFKPIYFYSYRFASSFKMSAATDSTPKHYIISVKNETTDDRFKVIKDEVKNLGGEITNEFEIIKAFSVKLPAFHTASVSQFPEVVSIEEDKEVHTL